MAHERSNQPTLGLTPEEQRSIKAAAARLPCGWRIALETTENQETYARVVPPWNPNKSAFLIDREYHGVILTDNITDELQPAQRVVCNVGDAVDRIAAVVSGILFF